ncbi:hypothetical protein HK098_002238 [Nowakowskiella sp. JEL0407]|nr:hypothetical protein HK098_002238 [Nowakowskiella sp. JEL0407]
MKKLSDSSNLKNKKVSKQATAVKQSLVSVKSTGKKDRYFVDTKDDSSKQKNAQRKAKEPEPEPMEEEEEDVINLPSDDEDMSELEWETDSNNDQDADEDGEDDELSELDEDELSDLEKEILAGIDVSDDDEEEVTEKKPAPVGTKRKEPVEAEKSVKKAKVDESVDADSFDGTFSDASVDGEEVEASIEEIDAKLTKKEKKQREKKNAERKTPGVAYLSRIPHGFYEKEMHAYFSQFGEVTRLRLCRNRQGHSKHYAFIEFANEGDAQVVAETMDNYLLFNHLLKCKLIPADQVHPKTFLGWTLNYRPKPWNYISRKAQNSPKSPEKRTKIAKRLLSKEEKKREKLRELGIAFDFPGYEGDKNRRLEEMDAVKKAKIEAAAARKKAEEEKSKKSGNEKKSKSIKQKIGDSKPTSDDSKISKTNGEPKTEDSEEKHKKNVSTKTKKSASNKTDLPSSIVETSNKETPKQSKPTKKRKSRDE